MGCLKVQGQLSDPETPRPPPWPGAALKPGRSSGYLVGRGALEEEKEPEEIGPLFGLQGSHSELMQCLC